ncbi:SMI1/KNR4 family protein [Streptomyces sp. NBC_00893]|uniref:SMI1/KNR4 family protein n=1 Tax=Streptomyces sp. NBC_00893 TaxID=2975862 RepID=UPI0022516ED3|nr:SMI1/KNR4 family protein [Streptomyces sp. NBC_00893]MCX4845831.1 SMI1/KNR4 family protein [Streptomyces sp. NBC_00893]
MRPDLTQLRDLIEESPGFARGPAGGVPEALVREAETRVGPLPPSYRWWLAEYGHGRAGDADIATVAPAGSGESGESGRSGAAGTSADDPADEMYEAVTAGWRRDGERLCFAVEPDCGDEFRFALDRAGEGGEYPVVGRDGTDGCEYPVAESFAGFLAVRAALSRGLRDGPNPAIARLWRSTPGVLLDNGVHVYGPHLIQERNETFEVPRYAPGWVLVGDDSGGDGLFMRRHGRDRTTLYLLGLGAAGEDIGAAGEPVTDDLLGWLRAGGPLPG